MTPDAYLIWLKAELERARALTDSDRYNTGYRLAIQTAMEVYESARR